MLRRINIGSLPPRTVASVSLAALLIALSEAVHAFDCTGILPAEGDELRAEVVVPNLTRPVDVQAAPGDTSRLFIVEQRGQILILDLSSDALKPGSFLDIVTKVVSGGETGLLGLAFHPDYAANGFFFVNYTRRRPGTSSAIDTVVSRFKVSADNPDAADPAETVLLTFEQPYSNHNGGQLQFGPDRFLYISTGDGGDAGDPGNRAQNPAQYLGKLLRIDVGGGPPYGIPAGNPFAGSDGILDEIWALGLRNPWRFCFDPETGDVYIADVGQGAWEEIDFQPASSTGGENYEWKVREGNHSYSAGTAYGPGTRVAPILEYPHSGGAYNGCSITGGVVYRGCRMPALHGAYLFADYCSDFIRTFRYENGQVVDLKNRTTELNANLGNDRIDDISCFGTDGHGDVYICDLRNTQKGDTTAKLYRIVPKNPPVAPKTFVRGNTNGDGALDLSDAVFTLGHLFLGNPAQVACEDALDANDDGNLDVSDAVYSLLNLFTDGTPPPAPYPDCGEDPTADGVGCATSTCGS